MSLENCSCWFEGTYIRISGIDKGFHLLHMRLQANISINSSCAVFQILQNLIKSRGADQKRSSAAQVYTAQKLCDLDKRVFDVVLKECNFEDAADHLITYLNKYYDASRPTQTPKRSDQLLRSSLNPSMFWNFKFLVFIFSVGLGPRIIAKIMLIFNLDNQYGF